MQPGFGNASGLPPYGAAWSSPAPPYAHFNVYQFATSETGTSYGMPLGDRFAPSGYTSPELAYTPASTSSGSVGTWQVELQANNGCAEATGLSGATSGSSNGGTDVTISGWNFHRGATVTFDGVPATNVTVTHNPAPTGQANSTITAIAPPGCPGPANVQVTNAYGSETAGIDTSALANAFTYTGAAPAHCKSVPAKHPPGTPIGTFGGFNYLYSAGSKATSVRIGRAPSRAASMTSRATTRVFVPGNAPYAFALKGLPKNAKVTVRVRPLHGPPSGKALAFAPFATVRTTAKGTVTLPPLGLTGAASSIYGSLQPEFQLAFTAPGKPTQNLLVLLRNWTSYLPKRCAKLAAGLSPCAAKTAANRREAALIASLRVAPTAKGVAVK